MATSISSIYFCFFITTLIVSHNHGTEGSPTGAPSQACSDMTPGHGVPVQNGTCPYVTTATVHFIRSHYEEYFMLKLKLTADARI